MTIVAISINAPAQAQADDSVPFSLSVKNTHPDGQGHSFYVEAWAPDQAPTSKIIDDPFMWAWAGGTIDYTKSFIMPNQEAEIFVWVQWWNGSGWDFAGTDLRKVSLGVAPPPPPPPPPPPTEPQFRGFAVEEYIRG